MTFTEREDNFISFGKIIILRSLKEMIDEGDNLNIIDFNYLIEKEMRNITDMDVYSSIQEASSERDRGDIDEQFEWKNEFQ